MGDQSMILFEKYFEIVRINREKAGRVDQLHVQLCAKDKQDIPESSMITDDLKHQSFSLHDTLIVTFEIIELQQNLSDINLKTDLCLQVSQRHQFQTGEGWSCEYQLYFASFENLELDDVPDIIKERAAARTVDYAFYHIFTPEEFELLQALLNNDKRIVVARIKKMKVIPFKD